MKNEAFRDVKPKEQQVVTVAPQAVAARFTPCGEFLVAGCFDGQLRRFQYSNETTKFETAPAVVGHNGWVEAFAFHPSKKLAFSGDSWGKLQCWTQSTDSPEIKWSVSEAHDGWIRSLAIDPSGDRIATCALDRKIQIRNSEDGKLLHAFQAPDAETFCVRFHPTRDELACGDLLGRVLRWNLKNGESLEPIDASGLYLLHRLQDVGGVRALAFDEQGERIAVGGTRPKNGATVQGVPTVFVYDYEKREQLYELKLGATNHCFVHDIVFHPDGFLVAVTSGTPGAGQIVFQAIGDEKPFFTHSKIPNCHSVSWHPDGKRFAVAATNRGSNGNGRRLNKDGEYQGNNSPIHVFQFGSEA